MKTDKEFAEEYKKLISEEGENPRVVSDVFFYDFLELLGYSKLAKAFDEANDSFDIDKEN